MGTTSKLFWFGLAAEVLVTGVIGWKIANARTHAWDVTPPPRKPNPFPYVRTQAQLVRTSAPRNPTGGQTPVCPAGTEVCGDALPGHMPPCCAIKVQGPTPVNARRWPYRLRVRRAMRMPNPMPMALDVRGQRQRAANPVSYRNAVAGSFEDEGVES